MDLRAAASLDVCVALDCTGSMAGCIRTAKDEICSLVDAIQEFYPDVPLRIAFVGYPGAQRLVVLSFTTSIEEFKAKLSEQVATGGGDGPVDIMGCLDAISKLQWKSATRILFHVGDAPCHGTRFHDMGDDHPAGDPLGLTPEVILPNLRDQQVQILQKDQR
jgi:hypothetical protein